MLQLTCRRILLVAALGAAHAAQNESTATLRFEVASIKPAKDGGGRAGLEILPGGGLRMDGATLRNLIAFAYDVGEGQVSGGPKWIGSDAYNVLAKPERPAAADNGAADSAPGTTAWDRVRLRTQALLAERFKLAIHKNSRDSSGYALVRAKNGPKLREAQTSAPPGTMRGPGRIDGRAGTMKMLAAVLSQFLGRPVDDRTGLTGRYTYKLEYAQEPGAASPADEPAPNLSGPSIFQAIEEQLGLRLDRATVSIPTIVVDRAEKPSAN
ncbi:MAG TPA: TIGR03435 family protein [Bryobacteraceae bacterium]|jgi:uncharacterized protein (TIGR03435 family)